MTFPPKKYTLTDPSLPHQVVFFTYGNAVVMSCNCRSKLSKTGKYYHQIICNTDGDLDKARRNYNNPVNHRIPFHPEDEAKW